MLEERLFVSVGQRSLTASAAVGLRDLKQFIGYCHIATVHLRE